AFEVALRLGAIYAGTEPHEEVADVLAAYSEALGIAYQIRDDLSDLGSDGETNDIAGMRPSLLLAVAYERAQGGKKELLESLWRRSPQPGVGAGEVEIVYTELKADERARHLYETYKEEAIRSLRDLENPNLKGLLRRVIGKIFNDTEIKGWCKEFEQRNAGRRMVEEQNSAGLQPATSPV
ncbi:MAG TPA: polyprenyl synthetase family protein, partial [Verrucomicrobiae bacterium]|nr:polyprenyl synthetase family protein [Verrucomicrobiae bacterium]